MCHVAYFNVKRPTEVEQHIFGSQEAYAESPRPSDAFLREQAKAAAQAQSSHPQMRRVEVLAECSQSMAQNQPNSSKPPSQPAPAPQSPASIQDPQSHPFLDTVRALSRFSPAQLSQIDRVAESIRDRMEKSTLERVEAQLHTVNAGRYDGDIVQLFFRRQALEQLRKRQSQLRMGMNGSPLVDPRNLTNGSPDINGQPAQQQQQQQQQQQRTQQITNPISIYPAQGDVDLNESHWSFQSDTLSRKRRGRPSPISARQPSPYRSHYADPLGSNRISPIRQQQPPGRSEYLSTPPFVLDSQELSPSGGKFLPFPHFAYITHISFTHSRSAPPTQQIRPLRVFNYRRGFRAARIHFPTHRSTALNSPLTWVSLARRWDQKKETTFRFFR